MIPLSIILAILVTIIMLLVVTLTPLLRESPPASSTPSSPPAPAVKPPFSFSRFQLFLWTFVIVPLFALHWGHWGLPCATCKPPQPEDLINTTALVLLGISAATAVSAGVVTSAQQGAAANAAASGQTQPAVKANNASVNFWTDILADNNGQFSISRLQQLLFTLIFIGIFITAFFSSWKFPDFGNNAFVLMGISTGSYVVGKSLNV